MKIKLKALLISPLFVFGIAGMAGAGLIDATLNTSYQILGGSGDNGDTGTGGQGGRGGGTWTHNYNTDGEDGGQGGQGGEGGKGGNATWTIEGIFQNEGMVVIGGRDEESGLSGDAGYKGHRGGTGGLRGLSGWAGWGPLFVTDSNGTYWLATGGSAGLLWPFDNNGGKGADEFGAGGGGGAGYQMFIRDAGDGGNGGYGANGAGGSGAKGASGTDEYQTTGTDFTNSQTGTIRIGGSGGEGGTGGQGGQGGGGKGGQGSFLSGIDPYFGGAGGDSGSGGQGGNGGAGGDGTVSVKNIFNSTGHVVIKSGSMLNIEAGGSMTNTNSMTNWGNLNNAGDLYNSGILNNFGLIHNIGTLTNNGEINGVGGTYLQTEGSTDINGTMTSDIIIIQGGTLSGNGIINGDTIIGNGAILTPGNSLGGLTIFGDLLLDSASVTEIELGGLIAGTEYDYLDVRGTAILGGELNVSFWDWINDPFIPETGDFFDIFYAETLQGEFDLYNFGTLSGGLHWGIDYLVDEFGSTDIVRLSVIADQIVDPVPEPATMLLFGTGLVGLIGSRLRKKKR